MTAEQGVVVGSSVSHSTASLDELEAASLTDERDAVERLLVTDDVNEAFVLQTCNRVEAYVVAGEVAAGREALDSLFDGVGPDVRSEMSHEESIRHLLRVAAGIESLVVGEEQILGQVRDAYETARTARGIGPVLDEAVTKAIRVGERARNETAINDGVVSIASAAVKLAEETQGLAETSAVVVGVGEMGTLAAKHLVERVEELVLVNRTVERAERLAEQLDTEETAVEAAGLDELAETLAPHDIVISATGSPDWILEPQACRQLGQTFIVDITRPRDIPPSADELSHLEVYDLDKLESVTEKTRQMRHEAATRVEEIVDEEFSRLLVQYKRKRADTVISSMYESAERIKAKELETAFEKGEFDGEQRELVEAMADSIVNQLLAPPTNSLRDAAEEDDWSTIHTALRLFNPNLDGGSPALDSDIDEIPAGIREQLLAGGDGDD